MFLKYLKENLKFIFVLGFAGGPGVSQMPDNSREGSDEISNDNSYKEQSWYKNLDSDTKEKVDQLKVLEEKLDTLDNSEQLLSSRQYILDTRLRSEGDENDPEYHDVVRELEKFRTELEKIGDNKERLLIQKTQLEQEIKEYLEKVENGGLERPEETTSEWGDNDKLYSEIFGASYEDISKGKIDIIINLSEGLEKPKSFSLGNLPKEIGKLTYEGIEYTRIEGSLHGEFRNKDKGILKAEDGMKLSIGEPRNDDEIKQGLKETKEGLEGKDNLDTAIIEQLRIYGLSENIMPELIRRKIITDTIEDPAGLSDEEIIEVISEEYPGDKLVKKINDIIRPYLYDSGAYNPSQDVIDRLKAVQSQEDALRVLNEEMNEQLTFAQQNYPGNWTQKLGSVSPSGEYSSGELSQFDDFKIALNELLKRLFGIDFLSKLDDMNGGEYTGGALGYLGEKIGGAGSLELGSLSAEYESGKEGSLAINPKDNNGYPSFGTYQLNNGLLGEFAKLHGIEGNHLEPGKNTEFAKNWIAKVRENPDQFKKWEHEFIKVKNFDVQVNHIKAKTGININKFPIAIQNVVWSVAVQHGQNTSMITDVLKDHKLIEGDNESMIGFVEALYSYRIKLHGKYSERYNSERYITLQNLKLTDMGNTDMSNFESGATGINKAVTDFALRAYLSRDILGAAHCTDWVDKIYKRTAGKSVYDSTTVFNGVTKISGGTGIGAREYADREKIASIQPGNHIILDKPRGGRYNTGRTHSVIALTQPNNGLIKVVSYPNGGIPPRVEIYDLYGQSRGEKNGKPIRIQRP